jgi:hypothetical protein
LCQGVADTQPFGSAGEQEAIMKRISLLVTALVTVVSFSGVPVTAPASAQSPPDVSEFQQVCYDLIATGEFPGMNFGECLSFDVTADPQGFKAHLCDAIAENGELADLGFSSYSDCIRNIFS